MRIGIRYFENKMKKAERLELAKKCFKKIKALDLVIQIDGNWITLAPPSKIPVDLTADMTKCAAEIKKLMVMSRAPGKLIEKKKK